MAEHQHSSDEHSPPQQRVDRIGKTLRSAYEDVASEPLPQTFEDLLLKLR